MIGIARLLGYIIIIFLAVARHELLFLALRQFNAMILIEVIHLSTYHVAIIELVRYENPTKCTLIYRRESII